MADGKALVTLVRTVAEQIADVVEPDRRSHIKQTVSELDACPTVALAGRVSSGKSTLVNALVGTQIAPTDAGECTQVTTLYVDGAPERLELFGFAGERLSTLPGRQTGELGLAPAKVNYAVMHTPQRQLSTRYRVIDTPGLSSPGDAGEKATRRALVEGSGLPRPEIVLFLVEGGHFRADEVEFLRAMGASRLNTIVVLSRADEIGEGAFGEEDPFTLAHAMAERIREEHADLSRVILPVSGLLAESGEIGAVQEADARVLGGYCDRGVDEFKATLMMEATPESPLWPLLGKLGNYGVIYGRNQAGRGAYKMSEWLTETSGLRELNAAIDRRFRAIGHILKARNAIRDLRFAAMTSSRRAEIQTILERAALDPRLQPLREVEALENLARSSPHSPIIGDLERLLAASHPADVFGDADPATESIKLIGRCREQRLFSFSGVEKEALTVLERSYQLAANDRAR